MVSGVFSKMNSRLQECPFINVKIVEKIKTGIIHLLTIFVKTGSKNKSL